MTAPTGSWSVRVDCESTVMTPAVAMAYRLDPLSLCAEGGFEGPLRETLSRLYCTVYPRVAMAHVSYFYTGIFLLPDDTRLIAH
jgi:hypothetical protein